MSQPLLSIRQLTKTYPSFKWGLVPSFNNEPALKEVTLNLNQGEIYGLVGPNGSGKTTLLKILAHLVLSDSGELIYQNKSNDWDDSERLKKTLILMRSDRTLFWRLTGYQNLLFFSRLLRMSEGKQKIEELIHSFNLKDFIHRPVSTYSAGQMQMVALARSFLHESLIYLLDEPFAELDYFYTKKIQEMLNEFKKQGALILLTSHDWNLVGTLCDRVGVIHRGEILKEFSLSAYSQKEKFIEDLKSFFDTKL